MGRVKLQIKKIENNTNRQVTFSKRRNGIIKKAYELSVLCDIDIALIMFSPSGRLSHFAGRRRIEDVIEKYINLPEREREGVKLERNHLMRNLNKLKYENDMAAQQANPEILSSNSKVEELQRELGACQQQLQTLEKHLRFFEADPTTLASFRSLSELESYENFFMESLARVSQKKNFLLGNQLPAYDPFLANIPIYLQPEQEGMPNPFSHNHMQWAPDNSARHNQSWIFPSDPLVSLRDYVPMPAQMDPQVGCNTWQQPCPYASTDPFSAWIPPAPVIMQCLDAGVHTSVGMTEQPSLEAQVADGGCGGENVNVG